MLQISMEILLSFTLALEQTQLLWLYILSF